MLHHLRAVIKAMGDATEYKFYFIIIILIGSIITLLLLKAKCIAVAESYVDSQNTEFPFCLGQTKQHTES